MTAPFALGKRLPTQLGYLILPVSAFLVSRLFLFLVGALALEVLPERPGTYWHALPAQPLLDMWARWDSAFYLEIIREGYRFTVGEQSSVAFFPLYPLLVKALNLFADNVLLSGVAVSNLCLLLGLVYLYKLTNDEFGAAPARRTVVYLTLYPASFFFSAVYTESSFFLFTVMSFYYARRGQWGVASLSGMLASATRVTGVVMLGIVGLEWLRSHGWTLATVHRPSAWRGLFNGLRSDLTSLAALLCIPLGLVSYMLFLKRYFADPLAFMTVQSAWDREQLGPVAILWRDLNRFVHGLTSGEGFYYQVLLDVPALVLGVVVAMLLWRRLGASYGLFVLIGLLLPASSATQSLLRYLLVLFPVFMLLGVWGERRLVDWGLKLGFTALSVVCFSLFVNWYFVA